MTIMKKVIYLIGLILLSSLPNILSAQLPRGIRIPTGESTGGGQTTIPANPDADCNFTYTFEVGVFNLDLVNGEDYSNIGDINEANPLSLPNNDLYPPMQISYQIGSTTDIIEVDDFIYLTTPPDDAAPYMFVFSHTITVNVASLCNGNNSSTSVPFELSYSLITADGSPYPVCDFMQEGNLFDCNYYDCNYSGSTVIGIGPTPCNEDEILTSATDSFRCGDCTGFKLARPRTDHQPGHSENASEELTKNKLVIEVMPNPFDTYLNIKWMEATTNPVIRLYDASGRQISIWTNKSYRENQVLQADMTDLSKGIYFLHIQNEKESIYKKLIKS